MFGRESCLRFIVWPLPRMRHFEPRLPYDMVHQMNGSWLVSIPRDWEDSWATGRRCGWVSKLGLITTALALTVGCSRRSPSESREPVTVYCSVDQTFAQGVFQVFRERTGIAVEVVFDSEAGKTTGLVTRIIQEAKTGRPRADLFWSSELFNTILLARRDLLESYVSPAATDIPPRFKDTQGRWTATAARARVLAFDPTQTDSTKLPREWEQLANVRFADQVAIANPLFGTTRGHIAAMFALWGNERGRLFLQGLHDGGALLSDSNGATVRAIIAQRKTLAVTDTDDVWLARRSGASLDLIYPDMGGGGTLIIPCSVAIVRGCESLADTHRLYDFLVSAEVEAMLFQSDSRNIPVRAALRQRLGTTWPPETVIEFDAIADAMSDAVAAVREILLR